MSGAKTGKTHAKSAGDRSTAALGQANNAHRPGSAPGISAHQIPRGGPNKYVTI
jgi:hypothetical protein